MSKREIQNFLMLKYCTKGNPIQGIFNWHRPLWNFLIIEPERLVWGAKGSSGLPFFHYPRNCAGRETKKKVIQLRFSSSSIFFFTKFGEKENVFSEIVRREGNLFIPMVVFKHILKGHGFECRWRNVKLSFFNIVLFFFCSFSMLFSLFPMHF